jgi:hypothetical protein
MLDHNKKESARRQEHSAGSHSYPAMTTEPAPSPIAPAKRSKNISQTFTGILACMLQDNFCQRVGYWKAASYVGPQTSFLPAGAYSSNLKVHGLSVIR